MIIYLLPLMLP